MEIYGETLQRVCLFVSSNVHNFLQNGHTIQPWFAWRCALQMITFTVRTLIEHASQHVQTLPSPLIKPSTMSPLDDAWKTVLKHTSETTQLEDATQLLNNARLVGVTITTTVVYIYVQDQLLGILLETTPQGCAQSSVVKDFMQILLLELVSVFLSVPVLMIFMETKLELMIHSETIKPTDVRLSVWLLDFLLTGILTDVNLDAQVTVMSMPLQLPAQNDQPIQITSTSDAWSL